MKNKKQLLYIRVFVFIIIMGLPYDILHAKTVATYTILLYMVGSDLEMKNGSASMDLKEMEDAMRANELDNVQIVVQAGGSKFWKNEKLKDGSCFRFLITNQGIQNVENMVKVNMGKAETLTDFLNTSLKKFPADHTFLLFWNHGNGVIDGFGRDSLFHNDSLTLPEISDALSRASLQKNQFSFIGFDACLMATYEVGKILESYTRYVIASQNTESSFGWDYAWLSILKNTHTTDAIMKRILQTYKKSNEIQKNETYTLSVLSLAKLKEIDECLQQILQQDNLIEHMKELARNRRYLMDFGMGEINVEIDSANFLLNMNVSQQTIDAIVQESVSMCVNGEEVREASGMSFYLPQNLSQGYKEMKLYKQITNNDVYLEFLQKYRTMLLLQKYDLSLEAKPMVERGIAKLPILKDTIQSSSLIAVSPIFHIENKSYSLGYDTSLKIGDNMISKRKEDRWFFLERIPLYIEVDENENKRTRVNIIRNQHVFHAELTFEWDDIEEQAVIIELVEKDTENFPMKNNIVLQEGDEIYPLYPEITFHDVDYFGWKWKQVEGDNMKYHRDSAIEISKNKDLRIQRKQFELVYQEAVSFHFVVRDFKQQEYYSKAYNK